MRDAQLVDQLSVYSESLSHLVETEAHDIQVSRCRGLNMRGGTISLDREPTNITDWKLLKQGARWEYKIGRPLGRDDLSSPDRVVFTRTRWILYRSAVKIAAGTIVPEP